MKMTKKVRDQIVKEMKEIRQKNQDKEYIICMLSNEISSFKEELKKIVVEQERKYIDNPSGREILEVYGTPETAFEMLYYSIAEKSEEDRKMLYDFIKNVTDRVRVPCPPLEVFDFYTLQAWVDKYHKNITEKFDMTRSIIYEFDDDTKDAWFIEHEKMFDILDSLNNSHYALLDEAAERGLLKFYG